MFLCLCLCDNFIWLIFFHRYDDQFDALDGMDFDLRSLFDGCFRSCADRGPDLSVDLDLTDCKRLDRLNDDGFFSDQGIHIGLFGTGLKLFYEDFARKDQNKARLCLCSLCLNQ